MYIYHIYIYNLIYIYILYSPAINSFLLGLCHWMPFPIYVPTKVPWNPEDHAWQSQPVMWEKGATSRFHHEETVSMDSGHRSLLAQAWQKSAPGHAVRGFLPAAHLRIQWRQHSCPWWGVPTRAAARLVWFLDGTGAGCCILMIL